MPRALEEKPEVTEDLSQYVEAFALLSHFRDINGNIGYLSIVQHARLIDEQDVLGFVSIIVAADRAYMSAAKEKQDFKVESK